MQGNIIDRRLMLLFLFGLPLFVLLGKLPGSPAAGVLAQNLSLLDLPQRVQARLEYVMFIPLSAVVVVLFRLTLGIRVFGLFRPILLAIAFKITGLELGLIFLAMVMATIVLVRPLLRVPGMHTYAREAVALGSVVVTVLVIVAAGVRTGESTWLTVARFPIISLCLISEHFAKALYEKGVRNAVWRGSMTVLTGVLICLISRIPGLMHLFLKFPELLIAQIGCIIVVQQFLNLRLIEKLHGSPAEVKEKRAAILTEPAHEAAK